jgi:hypothetical protein
MNLKLGYVISETVYLHLPGIDGGSTVWRDRVKSGRAEECCRKTEAKGEWQRQMQDGR